MPLARLFVLRRSSLPGSIRDDPCHSSCVMCVFVFVLAQFLASFTLSHALSPSLVVEWLTFSVKGSWTTIVYVVIRPR